MTTISTGPSDNIEVSPVSPLAGDAIIGQSQGRQFLPFYLLSWFGVTIALGAMLGAAIPKVFLFFDEAHKEQSTAIVTAIGGVVVMIITPLFGRLSDRTMARWGMRKPWMLGGLIVGMLGAVGMASSTDVGPMMVSWAVVQMGFGAVNMAIHALLADQIPGRIRARVAAVASISAAIATVLSAAVVASLPNDAPALWFLVPAIVGVALCLPLVFGYKDAVRTQPAPPLSWREIIDTFWLSPVKYKDYFWAWISRFLVTMAIFTIQLFLLFLIVDSLGISKDDASAVLTQSLVVFFAGNILAAPIFGWLSDRWRRRKPIIWISNVFAGIALATMMFAHDLPAFLAGVAVLGLAQGAFVAVDVALMTEVLPSAEDAGKDLGIAALSYQLPQVIGPVVGAAMIAAVGYSGLFIVAAVMTVLGGLAVLPIKAAR